jgi:TM2 domain-containing membrane protein YozV
MSRAPRERRARRRMGNPAIARIWALHLPAFALCFFAFGLSICLFTVDSADLLQPTRSMSISLSANRSRFRSKTLTAASAFLLGSLGAHRFYLYGLRDAFGWAHIAATLLGIPGVLLLVASARTSTFGWVMAIPGAISLLTGFLAAIVYGLRPDQKWDAQFNAGSDKRSRSGWTVVFVVIFSLFIGAMLLMAGLALAFQTYFESQVGATTSLSQ